MCEVQKWRLGLWANSRNLRKKFRCREDVWPEACLQFYTLWGRFHCLWLGIVFRCSMGQPELYAAPDVERKRDLELTPKEKHHPESLTHLLFFTTKYLCRIVNQRWHEGWSGSMRVGEGWFLIVSMVNTALGASPVLLCHCLGTGVLPWRWEDWGLWYTYLPLWEASWRVRGGSFQNHYL